jgi:hypothetical protein
MLSEEEVVILSSMMSMFRGGVVVFVPESLGEMLVGGRGCGRVVERGRWEERRSKRRNGRWGVSMVVEKSG